MKPSLIYSTSVTVPELAMLVLGLNCMTVTDRGDEFTSLRTKLTKALHERAPDLYHKWVANGEIEPLYQQSAV